MPEAIEDAMATAPTLDIDLDLYTDEELAAMLEDGPYAGFADGPTPFDPFAEPLPDEDDTALAGRDGARAGALLKGSVANGRDVLRRVTEAAVERLLADADWRGVTTLFDDDELAAVQGALAATRANGDLLGRARVRRLAEIANKPGEVVPFAEGYRAFACPRCGGVMYDGDPARKTRYQFAALCEGCGHRCGHSGLAPAVQRFAEAPPDDPFSAFADETLPPHPPGEAAAYFRRLVPKLGVRPERYAPYFDRTAFSFAAATDEAILGKVKAVIQDALDRGEYRDVAAGKVEDVLDAAGVSARNPAYSDTIFRTNAMDAYVQGQQAEYAAPEVRQAFPAWEYHAVPDERARPHHAARNGLLYGPGVTFQEVRGTDAHDVCNCRCSWSPVHRRELERRLSDGETIQEG
jgi:predicted RNA-binding Zn-ribbon protein involved in translation (DUF1610 family)